jgi:hypothetical protein
LNGVMMATVTPANSSPRVAAMTDLGTGKSEPMDRLRTAPAAARGRGSRDTTGPEQFVSY